MPKLKPLIPESTEENAAPTESELEMELAEVRKLKDELLAMQMSLKGTEPEEEEPWLTLDKTRPYATHRTIGGVSYEQNGKLYTGSGRLIANQD